MTTMRIDRETAKELARTLPTEKLQEIMRLRKRGESNYDISEKMGLPYPHVVHYAIQKAIKYEYSDSKKYKRQEEELKLDHLYKKAYEAFQANGNPDWFDRILATMTRKAKLLGLDAPSEQVLTGKDGGPVQFEQLNLKGMADGDLATMKVLLGKAIKEAANGSN